MSALWLVRILRRLPHSYAFDRHLDNCAAHEVLDRAFDERLPELSVAHVLRRKPLPKVEFFEPEELPRLRSIQGGKAP